MNWFKTHFKGSILVFLSTMVILTVLVAVGTGEYMYLITSGLCSLGIMVVTQIK